VSGARRVRQIQENTGSRDGELGRVPDRRRTAADTFYRHAPVYAADGRLYLRSLSDAEARPIPGADPAIHPAFSPDSQSIVFWTDPALKRVSVAGGLPVTVCETAPAPFGIDWNDNGILFVQPATGIMRVSQAENLVWAKPRPGSQ
jgi:hypothetical protein